MNLRIQASVFLYLFILVPRTALAQEDYTSNFDEAPFNEDIEQATEQKEPADDGQYYAQQSKKGIFIEFKDTPLDQVIRVLLKETGINYYIPPDVGETLVDLSFKNVEWSAALRTLLESHGLGYVETADNIVRIDKLEKIKKEKETLEDVKIQSIKLTPTTIAILRLSYATAEEASKLLEGFLEADKKIDPRVQIRSEERTNSVVIEAIPQVISKAQELVKRIDLQTPQVRISSRIIEVLDDFNEDFGISWGGPFAYDQNRGLGFGNLNFPSSATGNFAVDAGGGGGSRTGTMNLRLGSINNVFSLDVALGMLEAQSQTKILQSNNIVVNDNVRANLNAGTSIYFRKTVGSAVIVGGSGGGGGGGADLDELNFHLSLSVTPHITSDGSVSMELYISSNEPNKSALFDSDAGSIDRDITTTLMKKSNETAVIGGLYTNTKVKLQQGVPFLSKIPIIGALFRNHSFSDVKRELIILITPTILNNMNTYDKNISSQFATPESQLSGEGQAPSNFGQNSQPLDLNNKGTEPLMPQEAPPVANNSLINEQNSNSQADNGELLENEQESPQQEQELDLDQGQSSSGEVADQGSAQQGNLPLANGNTEQNPDVETASDQEDSGVVQENDGEQTENANNSGLQSDEEVL